MLSNANSVAEHFVNGVCALFLFFPLVSRIIHESEYSRAVLSRRRLHDHNAARVSLNEGRKESVCHDTKYTA